MQRAIDDYETEEKQWNEAGIPDPDPREIQKEEEEEEDDGEAPEE